MKLKNDLLKSAEHFANSYYDKDSIIIEEGGQQLYLTLGDQKKEGYNIQMDVWNDGTLNRIIISTGKVPQLNNQSVYVETREQEMLDAFLHWNDGEFYERLDNELNRLERNFERKAKMIKDSKGA